MKNIYRMMCRLKDKQVFIQKLEPTQVGDDPNLFRAGFPPTDDYDTITLGQIERMDVMQFDDPETGYPRVVYVYYKQEDLESRARAALLSHLATLKGELLHRQEDIAMMMSELAEDKFKILFDRLVAHLDFGSVPAAGIQIDRQKKDDTLRMAYVGPNDEISSTKFRIPMEDVPELIDKLQTLYDQTNGHH